MNQENERRVEAITAALQAIGPAWDFLQAEIDQRIAQFTAELVNANNEETRGRIKALVSIRELPDTLEAERRARIAALSEESDAALTPGLSA